MLSSRKTRQLVVCWLLLCSATLCPSTAHCLFARLYSDGNCTQPLPQYDLNAPALNYTTPFGQVPFLRRCGALPGTAGLYLNYSCGVPVPETAFGYLDAYVVNSSDCSINTEQSVLFLLRAQNRVNGSASTCLPMGLGNFTGLYQVRGYGYWSCAAQTSAARAKAPSGHSALVPALFLVLVSVMFVAVLSG